MKNTFTKLKQLRKVKDGTRFKISKKGVTYKLQRKEGQGVVIVTSVKSQLTFKKRGDLWVYVS